MHIKVRGTLVSALLCTVLLLLPLLLPLKTRGKMPLGLPCASDLCTLPHGIIITLQRRYCLHCIPEKKRGLDFKEPVQGYTASKHQ